MPRAPRTVWTPELEQRLREHYAHTRTEDLARALGLPLKPVQRKAYSLGLRKDRALIVQMSRERATAPGHPSHAHRWQPGAKPWNAGRKGVVGHHPNTRATQFRPGNRPATWVPLGSFRVRADGLEIKYSDEPGPPHRRWRLYGTHLWIEAHGPVPAGHVVAFKAGCASTDPARITLDSVQLITRRELMARNTMHRLPKPLALAVQLRGVLNRAIHRRAQQLRQATQATEDQTP